MVIQTRVVVADREEAQEWERLRRRVTQPWLVLGGQLQPLALQRTPPPQTHLCAYL